MNISPLKELGRAPVRLWHRFHIWRAKRMYARVIQMDREAHELFEEATRLMRRHAEDPQARLPLGDD